MNLTECLDELQETLEYILNEPETVDLMMVDFEFANKVRVMISERFSDLMSNFDEEDVEDALTFDYPNMADLMKDVTQLLSDALADNQLDDGAELDDRGSERPMSFMQFENMLGAVHVQNVYIPAPIRDLYRR
jgi:hypothetical protein